MKVVLTGGTGLVGGAVLRALVTDGHAVIAIVRSDASAAAVADAGASAVIGDLADTAWLSEQLAGADGAIHTASPGDASSADFDSAVVGAAIAAFRGTGKPYVHTGGVWVYGSGADITEDTPFDAPALTAWRADVEQTLLDVDTIRGVVVAPGVVYGNGQGLPAMITTPDESGDIHLVGDGSQHWSTVSADQLADLYLRALTTADARGYYLGVNDDRVTVHEIGAAAAARLDGAKVIAESADQSRERLFAPLVDALLLDQVASNARARQLGWSPVGPSLLDEIAAGSYSAPN